MANKEELIYEDLTWATASYGSSFDLTVCYSLWLACVLQKNVYNDTVNQLS